MFEGLEIFVFLVGFVIWLFVLSTWKVWMEASWRLNLLIYAFSVLLVGLLLSVLEGIFFPDILNLIEHICYASSSILLAAWCWIATSPDEKHPGRKTR